MRPGEVTSREREADSCQMYKSQSSTIDLTGQTPLGGDLTFRGTCPSSWRLFSLSVLYLWRFYYAWLRLYCLALWLMNIQSNRGGGGVLFPKVVVGRGGGVELDAFKIQLTEGFYALKTNPPPSTRPPPLFFKVVWRSSLQGSRWQLPCGIWGSEQVKMWWNSSSVFVSVCVCVSLCVLVCV